MKWNEKYFFLSDNLIYPFYIINQLFSHEYQLICCKTVKIKQNYAFIVTCSYRMLWENVSSSLIED